MDVRETKMVTSSRSVYSFWTEENANKLTRAQVKLQVYYMGIIPSIAPNRLIWRFNKSLTFHLQTLVMMDSTDRMTFVASSSPPIPT